MSRAESSCVKRSEGWRKAWPAFVLFLALATTGWNEAFAAVTLSGASGGGAISADTAANASTPAWTTLGAITITEGANGDFAPGTDVTLVIQTPAGFEFNTAVTPSISFTAGRNISSASITVTDTTNLVVTLTVDTNTSIDSLSIGSTTGMQVRPVAGSPLATGRHLYRPSTNGGTATISGITTSANGSTGSNFGNLTETIGAASMVRVETAANGSGTVVATQNVTAGTSITSFAIVRDVFGNFITNAAADVWSLPVITGGVVNTNLVPAGNRKSAVFTGRLIGTAVIRATSGSLTTTDSGTLTVVSAAATRLFVTLPGQTFVPGIGNSGSPLPQTAGTAFIIPQLTAADSFTNIATGYSGGKTINYSGPGGNPVYTTSVNFTAGQSTTTLNTTLTRAQTTSVTASASGLTGVANPGLVVNHGAFTKLQILTPGETASPGTTTGKTGTPASQVQGVAFAVMVNSVDGNWNVVSTNDTVRITSSDSAAVLPANAALVAGARSFNVTLNTVGTRTVTASNVTHSFIAPSTSPAVTVTASPSSFTTNTFNFNYASRTALLADGWSFWATNGSVGRNTEITNGAVADYDQVVHPGAVRIPCDAGDVFQGQNDSRNTLFRQLSQNWVRAELETSFAPTNNFQQVNLLIYQHDDEYLAIDHGYNSSEKVMMYRELNTRAITVGSANVTATNVHFRFDRNLTTDVITGSYSLNGTSWTTVGQWIQGFANPRLGIFIGGSAGGLPSVDVRRVAVVTCITNPPRALLMQPQALVFNATAGQPCTNLQQLRVVLTRDQDASAHWTLTNNTSWLLTSVGSGNTPGTCNVSVNTAGLAAGVYQATLNCGAPGTVSSSANITLIVNPATRARVATWKGGMRGAMSVSVDDSDSSGFTELQASGLKGSYLMWHESAPGFYTDYYQAGMELGAHTISHCCFEVLRPTLRGDLEGNIAGLIASTPASQAEVISFAWPCGVTTIAEQVVAADYFLSARGYDINQLEDPTPYNFMNLKSFNSHEHPPPPPADLKTVVDDAIVQGKWFNLVLHGLENSDGAITYSVGKDIYVEPIGSVIKYILQRDRTVISNYVESANSIQFSCFRLPLTPSSKRSFETAISANDVLTLQIDITDALPVSGLTVNGTPKAFSIRSSNGQTNLFFDLLVTNSPQTVQLTLNTLLPLTVTADNKTRPYGQSNPPLTGSLVGVQNGDNITATYTTTANSNSPPGAYVISPVLSDPDQKLGNYSVVTNNGTLTITKASATVTLTNLNQVYNGTARSATATTLPSGLTVNFTYNGNAFAPTNAGSYSVVGTVNNSNYTGSASNTLTIAKAGLIAEADDKIRCYGRTNPIFTVAYTGFVNGDTTNDLVSLPAASSSATTASPPGNYTISLTNAADENYAFTLVSGSLTVTNVPAPVINSLTSEGDAVVITWTAEPGLSYRLQYRQFITDANWNDLAPDILATGPTATATNSAPNTVQRFYRVMLVPVVDE